jgi:hypothetical protein
VAHPDVRRRAQLRVIGDTDELTRQHHANKDDARFLELPVLRTSTTGLLVPRARRKIGLVRSYGRSERPSHGWLMQLMLDNWASQVMLRPSPRLDARLGAVHVQFGGEDLCAAVYGLAGRYRRGQGSGESRTVTPHCPPAFIPTMSEILGAHRWTQ